MGRRTATPDAGLAVLRLDRRAAPRGTARSVANLRMVGPPNPAVASVAGNIGRRMVPGGDRLRRGGRAGRRNSTASATNVSATTGRVMVALARKLCVQKAGVQKAGVQKAGVQKAGVQKAGARKRRATTPRVRTASRATANRSSCARARMSTARDRSKIAARLARATRQPRTRRAAPSGCMACTQWPPHWPIPGAGCAASW